MAHPDRAVTVAELTRAAQHLASLRLRRRALMRKVEELNGQIRVARDLLADLATALAVHDRAS